MIQEERAKYFCHFFIRTQRSAYVSFAFVVFTLLLMGLTIKKYLKSKKIIDMSKTIKLVYMLLLLWCIVILIDLIIEESYFWIRHLQNNQDNQHEYQTNSAVSKYIFGLYSFSSFLKNSFVLIIPYNWTKMLIKIYTQTSLLNSDNDNSGDQTPKQKLKYEILVKKILKTWFVIRFSYLGLLLAFLIVNQYETQIILFRILFVFSISQQIFTIVILIISTILVKKNILSDVIEKSQTTTIANRYIVLIVCLVLRLAFQSLIYIMQLQKQVNPQKCKVTKEEQDDLILFIAEIIGKNIMGNYLLIFVVLRVFQIQSTKIQMSESLLGAEPYRESNR